MLQPNRTKAKLARGEVVFGSEIMFPSADVVEILAFAGLDFIYMDMEHSSTTHESLANMIRAAELGGATPLVRIPAQAPGHYAGTILRLLDIGAMGIIVPHVGTKEQAQAVVDAVKYAPLGRRGMFDVGRQSGYGLRMPGPDYVRQANDETLVVIMIETVEAVENLGDILRVPGIDCVQIGSSDLSQSLGYAGRLDEPVVIEAIETILAQTREAGVACGVGSFAGFAPDRIARFLSLGAQFVNIVTQALLLAGVRHWNGWLDDAKARARTVSEERSAAQ